MNIQFESTYETSTVRVGWANIRTAFRQGDSTQPPLLILNGIGSKIELLTPFITAVSPERSVLTFDAPGIGGSSLPAFPLQFSGFAHLTRKVLAHFGFEQADVLGFSWGGGLAQQFALQYPDHCRHLILAGTSTGALSYPGQLGALLQLVTPKSMLSPSQLDQAVANLYGGAFRQNPHLAHAVVPHIEAPETVGYFWQLLAGMSWTSAFWLNQISQPTLILAGDDDPIIPLLNADLMVNQIPNAKLYVVEDGGHMFILTRAREISQIIELFLSK